MSGIGTDETAQAEPLRVRAPGKMFWIGEHSVLYGGTALVSAVDRYGYAELLPSAGGGPLRIESSHTHEVAVIESVDELSETGGPWALVRAVLTTIRDELPGFSLPAGTLRLDTTALSKEAKLGLGSSAVVACVTSAILSDGMLASREALSRICLEAHARFQGRVGSGGDVIAACFGGLRTVGEVQSRSVDLPESLQMTALYTGEAADTRTLVRSLRRASETNDAVLSVLARMRDVSARGIHSLDGGDVPGWFGAVREFHQQERELTEISGVPIVTPSVQRCVDVAEMHDCAAKASGAGGGDVVIAFASTPHSLASLKAGAEQKGIACFDLSVDTTGVTAWNPARDDNS